MIDDGPLLGTGHVSRSRTPISTSDGRFRGEGAGADDDRATSFLGSTLNIANNDNTEDNQAKEEMGGAG